MIHLLQSSSPTIPFIMQNPTAAFTSNSSGSEGITNLISQLPKQTWFEEFPLCQWNGYWYAPAFLEGVITAQSHFEARDDDIIIASAPKAGTTWLISLVSTIMNAPRGDDEDPLEKNNPHAIVNTLELQVYVQGRTPDLSSLPSPRIFHTHAPYSALPDSIKKSKCKMVYVARNHKDVFVSLWHFTNAARTPEQGSFPIEKAFESFCQGFYLFGPTFEHVVEYWKESLIATEKLHFVKYEELSRNPKEEVKKLSLFLGKPFLSEEEIDDVIRRCSIDRLKNLEVNKKGIQPESGMPYTSYFRRGAVGDWKKIFTPDMEQRLDQIARSKYEESGLNLDF